MNNERKITDASECLGRMVREGREFPDAEEEVVRKFKLSAKQARALRDKYDLGGA